VHSVALRTEGTRQAHERPPVSGVSPGGILQWALEGSGWALLRPAVDFALLCAAVVASLGGVSATVHVEAVNAPLLLLPPLVVMLFYARALYRTRLRALVLDAVMPVLSAISVATMAVAILGRLVNGEVPEQGPWLRVWLFSLIAVALGRVILSVAQRWARALRLVGKPVLIMGAGTIGTQLARRLENHPEYGLVPIGFLDEDPRSAADVGGRVVPVLGNIEDLDDTVRLTGVRHLIVAFSSVADARVSRLIQRCQELGVEVSVVPRMFDTINHRVGYDTVGGMPLMSFTAVDPRGFQFAVKHAVDRVLALVLLAGTSPLILCSALAVRLTSPGPALFRQRRVGRDGKVFDLLKLRSMYLAPEGETSSADDRGLSFLLAGDTAPGGVEGEDRRTRVGRFLRATSLDELPQLINVLRGDMSLVGPRPERTEFVELFGHEVSRYSDRQRVKSGITGWAQVNGLRGNTSLVERVEWDNYYIAHWSLGLDLKILVLTFVALFRHAE
jgi:exopolysaccharide biosynthesis polyprenyl glycosylphosphotransferase